MNPDRWKQIEEIFQQAADQPLSNRAAFLETACGVDIDLRKEVESLLNAEGPVSQENLRDVIADVANLMGAASLQQMTGKRIGIYRLTGVIGHGGMGTVYRAHRDDSQYQKEVALKIIKREMISDLMVNRFLQERQILANLEHPNIARLLDGGTTEDGLPFFVMEYIDGQAITEFCKTRNLSVQERVKLVLQVCAAIQYAHQKLVIHRDLKPSNILVDASGTPKLVDFGIAKLLNPDLSVSGPAETMTVLRMMTPDYASPEQVRGLPISTATDIYSLGAVLYEMLTGERAHQFKQYTPTEIERVICFTEVERPSAIASRSPDIPARVAKMLAGDLDNIILMSMRKEPERRYQSAGQLSEDILRYLNGHPVIARADTVTYRTAKFIRRHKLALSALSLVLISLLFGIVATTYQSRRAERRFQQVRKLANTFLFDFHDQIVSLPGSTKAREMLVQTALEYLDSLAKEAADDPSLLLELAAAYQKVADVQGDPRSPSLGRVADAVESYGKSMKITSGLLASDPENMAALRLYGICLFKSGDAKVEMGDVSGGIQTLKEAAVQVEKLYQKNPGQRQDLLVLIRTLRLIVDAQLKERTPAVALETAMRALELSNKMSQQFPSDESEYHLTLTLHRVGSAQMESGDLDAGMKTLQKILQIRNGLVERAPNHQIYKREWRLTHTHLGNLAGGLDTFNLGDSRMALQYYEKALSIAEELAKQDPESATFKHDVAICYSKVADMWIDSDPKRAVELYRKAQEINQFLLQNSSDEYRFVSRQALFARSVAVPLARMGDHSSALQQLQVSLETARKMVSMSPENYEGASAVHSAFKALGDLYFDTGDTGRAEEYYRQALETGEKFIATYPLDMYGQWHLANLYFDLGKLNKQKKNFQEALQWFHKSYGIWEDWPRRATSTVFDQSRKKEVARAIADVKRQL